MVHCCPPPLRLEPDTFQQLDESFLNESIISSHLQKDLGVGTINLLIVKVRNWSPKGVVTSSELNKEMSALDFNPD